MSKFNEDDFKLYDKFIVSEIEEGFLHLQFNNPKTLNAFSEKVWRDYYEILTKLDQIKSAKLILISSAVPKSFSSGLDLGEALSSMGSTIQLSSTEKYESMHQHIRDFQYCIGTPARIKTPTICLLNGINYGLALDISACCSIRVATADCRFSIREIKLGIPADIGSLQRLPNLINNKSLLYQYALTGEIFSSEDALRLGYVSKIVLDLKEGLKYCKELGLDINSHQQWAIKGTKGSIQDMIDGTTTKEGLIDIAKYNAVYIGDSFISSMPKL